MYTVSQNFTLLGIAYIPLARLFTASLSIREREGEREASPSSLPLCAGVLFSLAMLSMHSMIEQKYRKKEGCEQSHL